ncbi:MAG: hypothetical protein R3C01_16945 [Planctomycetaceae bacterium]
MNGTSPDHIAYWTRVLAITLRIGGTVELLALFSIFLPRDWLEQAHAALGMGEMPSSVVIDFLIRQSSLFYTMHGVLLWYLASDPVRFRPIVVLMGWTFLLFGPAFFVIDLVVGTPLWWAIADPAACAIFGISILASNHVLGPIPREQQ